MVNPEKIKAVEELTGKLNEYGVVGIVNFRKMPSSQLQAMKAKMRGEVEIVMSKKGTIRRALENARSAKAGIEKLEESIIDQPALIFSKLNPFKLYKRIDQNKAPTSAKGGEIAPEDIFIPKGDTPFTPGPVLGELQKAGLKAAVEAGKIVIKEDKTIVKAGQVIDKKVAEIITKLGIQPLQIGLDVVAVFENGILYPKSILAIDEKQYILQLQSAYLGSFNLAFNATYLTKDNASLLLGKAFKESRAVSIESGMLTKQTSGDILARAYAQMLAIAGAVPDKASLGVDLQAILSAAPVASAAPAAHVEEKKDDKKQEEAAAGLGALFG